MHDHLLDPDWAFLNHGSFGATPRELLEVQDGWRARMEAQPVRFLDRELRGLLAGELLVVAPFLGADAAGLCFVPNATTGVAIALHSLVPDLREGDELLTTDHRYEAVHKAMVAAVAPLGARVVQAPVPFPLPEDPDAADDAIVTAIDRALGPRTRLLVVDWITSPTAVVFPVARIVALARARGVPVLVDGAHAPGQVDVDLGALGASLFTGNLHKWLCAPKGCAVLHADAAWRDRLRHPVVSHFRGQGLQAEMHWAGTADPTAWLTAGAAVARHLLQGGPALRDAHRALLREARDRVLAALPGARPPVPDRLLGAMATLPLPWSPADAPRLLAALHAARVEVPLVPWGGRLWLRISAFAVHNTAMQYDRLCRVLREERVPASPPPTSAPRSQ